MDYFKAAFESFTPLRDEDAAVKFALNAVLMDNRVQELAELVVDGSQFGGMEGEPSWMLERRDVADEGDETAYPGWPAAARFRASVDSGAYKLRHPEYFMSREVLVKFLKQAIDAYVAADPSRATMPAVVALRESIS